MADRWKNASALTPKGWFDRRMPGQQLQAGLDRALGPAMLLGLERVHLDRHFGRRHDVGQEEETPSEQLGPVAQVEVLGQRVVLPAAGVVDGLAAPDAGGAIEIEKAPRAVAAAVFEDEVGIEQDRLDFGQQRVVLVDVPPARLHHADLRVFFEVRQRPHQKVPGWDEIGVENRDELPGGFLQAGLERSSLVAEPVGPVQVPDLEPSGRVPPDGKLSYVSSSHRSSRPEPGFPAARSGSPSRRRHR